MKHAYSTAWIILQGILFAGLVIPLGRSVSTFRGGASIHAIAITKEQPLPNSTGNKARCAGSPLEIQGAVNEIPQYMRNLLRPLSQENAAGEIIAVVSKPEQSVSFPSANIIPFLGVNISLRAFFHQSVVQQIVPAIYGMERSTAGLQLIVGDKICFDFSGWVGVPHAAQVSRSQVPHVYSPVQQAQFFGGN